MDDTFSDSVWIDATPQQVYDAVSDVTRHGEWSGFTRACEWDPGDGPVVGAHFSGHNSRPGRDWSTRSEVVAATPGREFAWAVNGGLVRWGFELVPAPSESGDAGTRLTHRWHLTPVGRDTIRERFGEEGITLRVNDAHTSIPTTLAAIKQVIEAS